MSNQCNQCGSYAINHHHHGRDGSDPDLCDVCYWHTRHDQLQAELAALKAQGVVQWPEADEIMQMAFEEGQPADDASGYCFELEEFDLFIERLMSEVARLNAAPVQQVSVPDVLREAIKWADHLCFECGALVQTRAPSVHVYNKTFEAVQAAKAMLAAAPSAGSQKEQG